MKNSENLKFFIVDDDPMCRALYQQHLANLGFTDNKTFENGMQCIKQLRDEPDVVLIDYNMAPYNGIEVLKLIKQYNQNIYSIIISGKKDRQVAFDAAKYGAFGYIVKGEKEYDLLGKSLKKIMMNLNRKQKFAQKN